MIFDEIADIMNTDTPLAISKKTGLSRSKVIRLRQGCPFVLDYDTVFALQRLGYVIHTQQAPAQSKNQV